MLMALNGQGGVDLGLILTSAIALLPSPPFMLLHRWGKLAEMISGKLLIIFTPSLPRSDVLARTKLAWAGCRFGDFSCLNCSNLPYVGKCNQFRYKQHIPQT